MIRRMAAVALALMSSMCVLNSLAKADDYAYESVGGTDFGIVDLNTGLYTEVGPTVPRIVGLGSLNGNIYGGGFPTTTLYQVNPTTATLTAVGNGSTDYWIMGSTTSGLYEFGSGSDDNNKNLYSVDQNTGAMTLIGASGIPPNSFYWAGMSTGGGTLYVAMGYGGTSLLYSLNTTTGLGTLIGDTGVSKIGAMVFENGVLYAGSDAGPYSIWTINTTTGIGTFVTNEVGAPNEFWGLAPFTSSSTPEPTSILLLGSGIAGIWTATRRKFSKR